MSRRILSLVEWHMIAQLLHAAQLALRRAAEMFLSTSRSVACTDHEPMADALRRIAGDISGLCSTHLDERYALEHPEEHCWRLSEARPCKHPSLCGLPAEPHGTTLPGYVTEHDPQANVAEAYAAALASCLIAEARVDVTEFGPVLDRKLSFTAPMVPTLGDLVEQLVEILWGGFTTTLQFKILSHGHVVRCIGYICMLRTDQYRPWIVASRHIPWGWVDSQLPAHGPGLKAISVDGHGNVVLREVTTSQPSADSSPHREVFVDADTGDDSYPGTRSKPIKTFAEWNRRVVNSRQQSRGAP